MQLNPRFATWNNDAFEVWVVNMIETAERGALRADEPAALKRYQLQTAEMVRQRIAVRIWDEGKAGRRLVPLLRRMNVAISRMRNGAPTH
jgi:hypothetical protein